jgi:hypothetical protein
MRVPDHFHLLKTWGRQEKRPLYTHAMSCNATHREAGVASPATQPHHNPLEYLHAFAIAFHDAIMHPDSIARSQARHIRVRLNSRD